VAEIVLEFSPADYRINGKLSRRRWIPGGTEKKAGDGRPHVAFTPFRFDLQGLDSLGCQF